MYKYILAVYGISQLLNSPAGSKGGNLLQSLHNKLPKNDYSNTTIAHMLKIDIPQSFGLLLANNVEFDIDYLSFIFRLPYNEAISRISKIESRMYKESLESKLLDINEYNLFSTKKKEPIKVYAEDFSKVVPLMDNALISLKADGFKN